jgi:hypothetical protein
VGEVARFLYKNKHYLFTFYHFCDILNDSKVASTYRVHSPSRYKLLSPSAKGNKTVSEQSPFENPNLKKVIDAPVRPGTSIPPRTPEGGAKHAKPEKDPSRGKKIRAGIGLGAAGLVVAGGAVVGVNLMNSSETPDTQPTTEPSGPEVVAYGPLSPELTAMEALSPAEFFNLSIEERNTWCSYYNQDLPVAAEAWSSITGNPLDQLPEAKIGNTAQEKMQIIDWKFRGSYMAHNNASLVLTQEQSQKMLSCDFVDMNSPLAQSQLDRLNENYASNTLGFPPELYATNDSLKSDVVLDAADEQIIDGVTHQDITSQIPGYEASTQTIITIETVDFNDNPIVTYGIK